MIIYFQLETGLVDVLSFVILVKEKFFIIKEVNLIRLEYFSFFLLLLRIHVAFEMLTYRFKSTIVSIY